MSVEIDRVEFSEDEFARMRERLQECVDVLAQVLDRPGFGIGPPTLGAELELFIVDDAGRPVPRNDIVKSDLDDERVTLELDRFNLECNLTPVPMTGRPWRALGEEMRELLDALAGAMRPHGGRPALIGILPTVEPSDLGQEALSVAKRYQALDRRERDLRGGPFRIDITGEDHLMAEASGVSLEGANTSFQLHLRVEPADFAATYNAAQLATAPALAVSGNSPLLLGHRLWEETRIALFKQSVDTRSDQQRGSRQPRVAFGSSWVRDGPLELFADAVRSHEPLLPVLSDEAPSVALEEERVPLLAELQLHQGTVWTWNRPVYDATGDAHVRIEFRALPSGPTVADMLAGAAFLLGVTLAIAPEARAWTAAVPFERAEDNFYRSAQRGFDAALAWPDSSGRLESVTGADLALRLLPVAAEALDGAGVEAEDVDRLLAIVEERIGRRRTGARWQRAVLDDLERRLGREEALAGMFERYLDLSASGEPVHTWPVG